MPFAPKGVALVNGAAAVPLTLPVTLDVGMLSPAPSFRALALEKYAYNFTVVRVFASAQEVVMLTGALPFAGPLAARVKFTVAGPAATVRDSPRTACKFTVALLEFS